MLTGDEFTGLVNRLKEQYDEQKAYSESLLKRLEEFDKDVEIKKMKDELDSVYRNSLVVLSDVEKERLDGFHDKHYCIHNDGKYKAFCNTYVYKITGTGLGNCIEVECPICHERLDITDVSSW